MPDYSRKSRSKEPVATIRMTTRTNLSYDGLYPEDGSMRIKVDPAKYLELLLGSSISLTESLSSTLRLTSPHHANKPSDALLQELSDTQYRKTDRESGGWNCGVGRNRALGTRRSATAPASRRAAHPQCRPSSTGSGILPNIPHSPAKSKHNYEINGEYDADATIVDADAVLDQGSELTLKDMAESLPARTENFQPRPATPPVPSADVLSKRQLKLIGTNTDTTSSGASNSNIVIDKALSQQIVSEKPIQSPRKEDITPSELLEMVGTVGERMMVNRARLLLMQHSTDFSIDGNTHMYTGIKPPTAPPGIARPSPLPSMLTIDSRSTVTERATTAPAVRSSLHKKSIRSSKLRSSSGCATWSVPCKSEGRARAKKLREPFIVQSLNPTNNRAHYPAPPPSESSLSSTTSRTESLFQLDDLQTTPHYERCANYRDPTSMNEGRGYTPLAEETVSLSETPLLQAIFSSLSSFLPSSEEFVN